MGIGWNGDVSAVKVPPFQCFVDAGIDVLDTPSRRELPSLATIGVDNRSKQETGDVLNCFSVSVSGNKFSPDTIIVKVGDRARINFTAVDKDYDFTQPDYGFSVPLPKSQKKIVEFQASAEGKFTFYCKSCGGLSKGPVGYLVVVSK